MKSNGFTKIENLIIWNSSLSRYAKLLFLSLSSRNPSFPSYRIIARDMSVSSKSVISNALKELVSRRIISYEKGSQTGNLNNRYIINEISIWDLKTHYKVLQSNSYSLNTECVLHQYQEPVPIKDSNNTNKNNINNLEEVILWSREKLRF